MDLNKPLHWSPGVSIDEVLRQVVLKAVHFYRGDKAAAARSIDVPIAYIEEKLLQHDVQQKAYEQKISEIKNRQLAFVERSRGIHAKPPSAPVPEVVYPLAGGEPKEPKRAIKKNK